MPKAPETSFEAQQMVAGGAGLEAARAGEVAGDDATQGLTPGGLAEQGAEIRRLEGQRLPGVRQRRLDLREGRGRLGAEDQFVRLIQFDAGESGQVQHMVRLSRPAPAPLGPAADDLQRRLLRLRPAHGVENVLRGLGGECFGHPTAPVGDTESQCS